MKEKFYLSCLLVSKICHDLIGSASSLSFSMDMIKEGDDMINKDALSLANKSSVVLVNRLKYFRVCFGISSISHDGKPIDKVREFVYELSKEKDININWSAKYDVIFSKALSNINIKLILNIFLIVFYGIPKSADIEFLVIDISDEEIAVMITVSGNKVFLGDDIIDIINNKKSLDDINPRNVHVYFTLFLKQEAKSIIEIDNSNNEAIKIAFSLKKI